MKNSLIYKRVKLYKEIKTIEKNNFFDYDFYKRDNRLTYNQNKDCIKHYCRLGWKEGKNPSKYFNTKKYLSENKDVEISGINPLYHYIKIGMKEGREVETIDKIFEKNKAKVRQERKVIKKSKLFNKEYYFKELNYKIKDPVKHYCEIGWKEGRNPSEYFDTKEYLEKYNDIKSSQINPLYHYITNGIFENREIKKEIIKKNTMLFKIKKINYLRRESNSFMKKIVKYYKKNGIIKTSQKIKETMKALNNTNISNLIINNEYKYIEPTLNKKEKEIMKEFVYTPKISIIIPTYNVEVKWIEKAIKSIENQWYQNYEVCIVDDGSKSEELKKYLKSIKSHKIKVKLSEVNENISKASNKALEMVTGEYIGLMDNDDEITPDALYSVVKELNIEKYDFIYSDEDKLTMDGDYVEPHFKPDYSQEMIKSQNYISHFAVIKSDLIRKIGGFEVGLEGAQDYDLYLKILDGTNKVKHIPKVLYHWRKIPGSTAESFSEKSYAQETGRKALENYLERNKVKGTAKNGVYPGTYRLAYEIDETPKVSIIIPFKDRKDLLELCIESVIKKTKYLNYEIVGISNNSKEKETFETMEKLEKNPKIKFYEYNIPFNYSKINNYAIKNHTSGDYIILLNNDIEIISENWIEELLMHATKKGVGAVGAKLLYSNDMLQHAGVICGLGGVAGHSHKYHSKDSPGYFFRPHLIQNLSAVTAALLMIEKRKYMELNGLDEENLKVAFNDVDFCLRLQEKGYRNIYTPYVKAYHYESISRGGEDNPEKIKRFQNEVYYMQKRHKKILTEGDPYYNKNLTLDREDFSLKVTS